MLTIEQARQLALDGSEPEPNSGCWIWARAASTNRYGSLRPNAWDGERVVTVTRAVLGLADVHRVVHHRCGTDLCVNPEHLYTDAARKPRRRFGLSASAATDLARDRSLLDARSGCWIWQGAVHSGYPCAFDGERAVRLSRAILGLPVLAKNAPRGDAPLALHRCDNPLCVNPAHLFIGSQTVNMRDMTAKGRHRSQNSGE